MLILFSTANAITRFLGKRLPAAKLHGWIFNWAIGSEETATEIRDELISRTATILEESETEIEESPEELQQEIDESRRRASSIISSGEFVLALLFGISGFFVSPWITFVASLVIALSASLRITAVESLAISSTPEPHSVEWLMAARGWNQGAVEEGRILLNTVSAVGIKKYDERAFSIFVEEIFVPSVAEGAVSLPKAIGRMFTQMIELTQSKSA
ncbi:hypothetical protein [Halomarina salina]|uniref:hypothetical protein n=1 Tax=Halomarina salina TaxID=1872699 RepID=UPI001FFB7530|nr:hypothetical protein [Halomarina salina]